MTEVGLGELSEIAQAHNLPLVEDLGAGTLLDLSDRGFPSDAFAPARLRHVSAASCRLRYE